MKKVSYSSFRSSENIVKNNSIFRTYQQNKNEKLFTPNTNKIENKIKIISFQKNSKYK